VIITDEMVEKACRAICRFEGVDPDLHVARYLHNEIGPKGHVIIHQTIAAWKLYAMEVRVALEATGLVDEKFS
jgi:hypothetical protein